MTILPSNRTKPEEIVAMIQRFTTALALLPLLVVALSGPSLGEEKKEKKKEEYKDPPTSGYKQMEIEGWNLFINKRLFGERADVGEKALQIIRIQLTHMTLYMPEKPLAELRKVPIWVDDRPNGAAQYHPGKDWLVDHGYNPDKVKSVDVSQSKAFMSYVTNQPYVMMHELAHAYHDRVLGFDDSRIVAAYKQAVASKKYEKVLLYNGRKVRHYALSNHKEYFAECSEAYFGTNDFYPFVRAELKEHDPDMYALLDEIWRGKPRKNKSGK
jgi:hypothetical protein